MPVTCPCSRSSCFRRYVLTRRMREVHEQLHAPMWSPHDEIVETVRMSICQATRHKRQELGFTSAVTSNTQIAVQAYLQHRCKSDHQNQTQDRLNCTPHFAFCDSLWQASAAFLCTLSKSRRFHGFSRKFLAQSCVFFAFWSLP